MLLLLLLFLCGSIITTHSTDINLQRSLKEWRQRQSAHEVSRLTGAELRAIAAMEDYRHFESMLDPILIPRVPDTRGSATVRKHIADNMRQLDWQVEEDWFLDSTPLRTEVNFTNVVATLDPGAPRRLVLACHYDSLMTPSGRFVGATDSAVPCAQLLSLAYLLRRQLAKHRAQSNEVTLQFIFFDCEEAFQRWSDTDSLYGSRHLANKLARSPYTATAARGVFDIHRIDLFVLLDLIGVAKPRFHSYFENTNQLYQRLVRYESQMDSLGLYPGLPAMFQTAPWYTARVQDDHIPFLNRDVPVLHLIPLPFPSAWHKDHDDKSSLDPPTIRKMNGVLRAFVVEYLSLQL